MKAHRAPGIFLCLSFFSACGGGSFAPGVGVPSQSLRSIQIAPSEPSIALGQNQQFTAIGHYVDGSSKDITASVVWASSNTNVVTISGSGFAGSHATGSVNISATLDRVAGYGSLTVTKAILVSIAITPTNPVWLLGTLQQFTATGTFSDQTLQDVTGSVTWVSSNNSVASISRQGLAAARALGSLTISATSSSVSTSMTVSVQSAVLSFLIIRPANEKMAQSTSQQFLAIGTYTDGSIHYLSGEVSWTSSNTTVAHITNNMPHGLVSALAPGTTIITARLGSISASTTLEVTNATLVSISIKPSERTIPPGTRLSFTAIGLFSDNTTQIITRDCTWSSDNHAVATIGLGSTATGVGPGTANISAIFNGVSGSAPLDVSSAMISLISVTPTTALLQPATSVSCGATGTFSDGSTQVITNLVNWTSSDSTVASVSTGGKVSAHATGSAIITAQFGSVNGDSTIVVDSSQLTSIQISPATASIPRQTTVAFMATGTFADGSTQDLTASALWTSSLPSVATIITGHANGVEPGTTIITALFGGQIGIASLTVTNAAPSSLVVLPKATNFEDDFTQFTALAIFSDGTTKDVTPWVRWASSSANVAVVSRTGLATNIGAGMTNVTATMNGLKGTAIMNVH